MATFIVGILSLCGVIINIIVTANTNKKKRYTDLITHNRVSTMENLKLASSNLISSLFSIMAPDCNYNQNLQLFQKSKAQIFYAINYKGKAELDMREALTYLEDLILNFTINHQKLSQEQKDKIFETINVGVDYYQMISCVYCKCEWQRAKNTSLYVKENYDTEKAYLNYIQPMQSSLTSWREILITNTYSNIVKK